jgi:TonB family protein
VDDTTLIFLPRLERPTAPQAHQRIGRPGGGGEDGAGVIVLSANPPPRGFQVVDLVTSVPTALPGVDANLKALDPRDFTGQGVEGGTGWGVIGGTGSADQPVPTGEMADVLYGSEAEAARFSPAEMLTQPRFIYPQVQLAAGVTGKVVIQFVVDTLGQVEPASLKVLSSTHEAFASSAREGILTARFSPAQYGGHSVRQLSRMPVSFATEMKPAAS